MPTPDPDKPLMAQRFRGFLPVIVDVETGGFDQKKDALLEIGAVNIKINDQGHLSIEDEYSCHVEPFEGANMEPASMEINGIDPYHPFRMAKPEEDAVRGLFKFASKCMKKWLPPRHHGRAQHYHGPEFYQRGSDKMQSGSQPVPSFQRLRHRQPGWPRLWPDRTVTISSGSRSALG